MQAAGWYPDPTGRHEFRYWRPGWGDLAGDGPAEVKDPLRPRWQKVVGVVLVAQVMLVPVIGLLFILHGDKPQPRAGVTLTDATSAAPEIVYAACAGERIEHVAVSRAATSGSSQALLWSALGDTSAAQPITIGDAPPGMTVGQELARPISPQADLVLVVATNRMPDPAELRFTMRDLAVGKVLSFKGTYDASTFPAAARSVTPCGEEKDKLETVLAKVLVGEGLLAVAGLLLLNLPHYRGPSSPYA